MNAKKIIASSIAAAMTLSLTTFSVLADNELALNAVPAQAASGDTITVTIPLTGTTKVQGISAELNYDDEALEYVSATSEFFAVTTNNTANPGNNTADGTVLISGQDVSGSKTEGKLMIATFRVKNGALGGAKEFSVSDIAVTNEGFDFITGSAAVTAAEITVQAPQKLAAPEVTLNEKVASWDAVANANTYNVIVKKGDTVLYNKDQAAVTFDFSKYVTETADYTVIVKANKNTSMYLESDAATATANYVVDAEITPTTKEYVKGSGGFEVTMTLNGNTLTGITGLTEGSDYTVTGTTVKIADSALTADTDLEFTFSAGNSKTVSVTVTEAADTATLVLAEREADSYATDDEVANDGNNDGLIVVTNPVTPVTNFIAAQFIVDNSADSGCEKVEYEIVPADGFAILYDNDTQMYEINVKPDNGIRPAFTENQAGEGIVIGKIVRKGKGYGKGTIKAGNITITVEKSDNSYATLTANGFDFLYDIPEPTEKLNVNVDFAKLPTNTNNPADYQKMAVTVYSPRLGNIIFNLGNDSADYTSENGKITGTVTKAENSYSIAIEGLPAFEGYTVSISGDGYRDAKAQVVLNEEATVSFWNNANDTDRVHIEKVGGEQKFVKKNFLAGDIIMNNVIDLYDLSAVSSYYGKKGLTADDEKYIQYDLNRDGMVDIIDITMLLAGWAE